MNKNGDTSKFDRRRKGNKTNTREMLKNQTICTSQVYNETYIKLLENGQLARFIAYVQYCSTSNFDIDKTLEIIKTAFPLFLDRKLFNRNTFINMIKTYPEISAAWGYGQLGDVISSTMIKNKALTLAMQTEKMEDIKLYNEIFNNSADASKNSGASFNFNITPIENN